VWACAPCHGTPRHAKPSQAKPSHDMTCHAAAPRRMEHDCHADVPAFMSHCAMPNTEQQHAIKFTTSISQWTLAIMAPAQRVAPAAPPPMPTTVLLAWS